MREQLGSGIVPDMESGERVTGLPWWRCCCYGRRHIAVQFDHKSDVIRIFLDGTLLSVVPAVKPISSVDVPSEGRMKKLALGHSHPGYTYGRGECGKRADMSWSEGW